MAEIQPTPGISRPGQTSVYLGTMWKEFLDADTYAKGPGSTVGRSSKARSTPAITGMAGVLTPAPTPTGAATISPGQLVRPRPPRWDYELSAEAIAREWIAQTSPTTRRHQYAI